MKKCVIISGVVLAVVVIMTAIFGSTPVCAAGSSDACALFTRADAEALFNQPASSQRAGKVSAPAGNNCTYFFKKKGGSFNAKLRVSYSDEIRGEGIFKSAKDVFDRQKKARMGNPSTAQKMKSIGGLGDEAFWNGYDLWVIKGSHLLTILVHDHLAGSFKSKEAMEKARAEQDLSLSTKAAMKILARMQ